MFKSVFRILALFALAMALLTGVLDITRSIADSTVVMTPFGLDWFNTAPRSLSRAQYLVLTYLHPLVWDPVIQTILMAPSWVVFACLWLIFTLIGRPRRSRWQDRFER